MSRLKSAGERIPPPRDRVDLPGSHQLAKSSQGASEKDKTLRTTHADEAALSWIVRETVQLQKLNHAERMRIMARFQHAEVGPHTLLLPGPR